MRHTTSDASRNQRRNDGEGLGRLAAGATAIVEGALPCAPWTFWIGLLILSTVTLLTMPGNPVLDLNTRQYREPATILAHAGALLFLFGLLPSAPRGLAAVAAMSPARRLALLGTAAVVPLAVLGLISMGWPAYARALTREWGLVEPAEATLYLTAAWIAWRHAARLGPRAQDARCFRFVAFFCGMLALEEMDWLGVVGPIVGRIGVANVYLGSSHDLLKVAWHYHRFAIPLALSALLVLGMVWYRGYLTVGFIRREMFDPTTLPLYGALLAQVVAQTLDVDDTILSARHPFFRYPLEEPFELLSELLLVSGLLLKYSRDRRRAGPPRWDGPGGYDRLPPMNATTRLAEFVTKSRYEDCPEAAIDAARRAILDCLGVMLAGSIEPAARILQQVARTEGGAPLATVVGTGRRTGAVWAALCNGTAAHALDFDDTNFALMGHPSAPVLAAALAAGELALADGPAVLHAFLLGFEVETTLAEVINPAHYAHGWHATCTLGTLGAAAAAARLLGLDGVQTRHALAVAASQSSGLKENFGTMTKPFHAGHAARSGVLSALMAREGWTASEHALEGPQGFFSVLGAGKRDLGPLGTLAAPWKILTTGVAVKPYPSCACTHSIIDSALELRRVEGIRADEVEEVTVGVAAGVPRILIHSRPRTGLEAKFSAEFSAAAALIDGRVGIATFQDERAQDPGLRHLMERIRVVVDPEIPTDLERHMWTRMTVRLKDGRSASIGPRPVPGHPANPLTREARREKFKECAALVLSADRVDTVAQVVESLDTCPDLRSLTAILDPGR